MLKWVVQKGTGTAVDLPAYPIAGKTGTAYKFMDGHYSKYNYVSSFVGFVPADNPQFVIYCSLDDPRGLYWGGYTAGPVFKEVAKRALSYALVPGVKNEEEQTAFLQKNLPSFLGLTRSQGLLLGRDRQVKLKFTGKGEKVVAQSPSAGTYPANGKDPLLTVTLTLGNALPASAWASGTMPDLRGKTKRQALALLSPLGLKVNFTGEGIVRRQFPPAGRFLKTYGSCDLSCDIPAVRADAAMGGHS
jgi:membrane peptidoglycan carboxypeptidase